MHGLHAVARGCLPGRCQRYRLPQVGGPIPEYGYALDSLLFKDEALRQRADRTHDRYTATDAADPSQFEIKMF